MPNRVKIFVEGIADKKFLEDYSSHIFPGFKISDDTIIEVGGWTNILSHTARGENIRNQMKQNTDNGVANVMIFDADDNFAIRKAEIEKWKADENLNFELFLFPDNRNNGALEDLLEKIILEKNKPVFDCWNNYEHCLQSKKIEGRGNPLTTPAKKTKIYGYLETLLGNTKAEKEKIKEQKRDYKNTEHWNLNADYLSPLKTFLLPFFLN
jgi:hypothetical protein